MEGNIWFSASWSRVQIDVTSKEEEKKCKKRTTCIRWTKLYGRSKKEDWNAELDVNKVEEESFSLYERTEKF